MNINMNPLRAGAWLFFATIIVYLLILKFTPANYEVNIKDANSDSTFEFVNLFDFKNSIDKDEDFLIIDISSTEKHEQSHLLEAIHVPVSDVLKKSNLKKTNNKKTFVYSHDENQSYEIAFLLMQMGIDALPLAGNYELISSYIKNPKEYKSYSFYHGEKTKYNYAIYFGGGKTENTKPAGFKMPNAKALGAKGGC